MATIGWYGPLINLSEASSHIGHYVQLLVFLHKSTPIQYKVSKRVGGGNELIRTDIQVGDETRSYFPVTIWQKQMHPMLVAREVILLQNVKITRFRDMVEARTVVCSSLKRLVHVHEIRKSGKGANDLVGTCHGGVATKDKLLKVIEWVHRAGLIHCSDDLNPERRLLLINWKQQAEAQVKDYSSLIELCHLPDSCETIFYASVGEIFLPITWRCVKDSEVEEMFISRRLDMYQDDHLVDDFISPGCQQCDIPLNSDYGLSIEQQMFPLYCQKSSNCQHKVGMIYRPFMLYVWDESKYIPLLVMNKAAELLFGNISAEKVYSCYQAQKQRDKPDRKVIHGPSHCFKEAASGLGASQTTGKGKHPDRNINFYLIWLFLLKTLLLQGKNDPVKLKISINLGKDIESGRYEMMSVSMPVFGSSKSSANPA